MDAENFLKITKQNLVGVKLCRNLNCYDYVISICTNVWRKLAVLTRLSKLFLLKTWILPYENMDTVQFCGCFIPRR